MAERISPKDAAKILGMDLLSVYGALQNKALPIGGAWHNDGCELWCYHISPHLLAQYTGLSKEEIFAQCKKKY